MSHPANDNINDQQRDNLGIDQRQAFQDAIRQWGEVAKRFADNSIKISEATLAKLKARKVEMQMHAEDVLEKTKGVSQSAEEYENMRVEQEEISNEAWQEVHGH